MIEKNFELGEVRTVIIELWLSDGTEFTPTDCTWALLSRPSYTEVSSGTCTAQSQYDGHWQLAADVEFSAAGAFRLQYSCRIGGETIKRSVMCRVA